MNISIANKPSHTKMPPEEPVVVIAIDSNGNVKIQTERTSVEVKMKKMDLSGNAMSNDIPTGISKKLNKTGIDDGVMNDANEKTDKDEETFGAEKELTSQQKIIRYDVGEGILDVIVDIRNSDGIESKIKIKAKSEEKTSACKIYDDLCKYYRKRFRKDMRIRAKDKKELIEMIKAKGVAVCIDKDAENAATDVKEMKMEDAGRAAGYKDTDVRYRDTNAVYGDSGVKKARYGDTNVKHEATNGKENMEMRHLKFAAGCRFQNEKVAADEKEEQLEMKIFVGEIEDEKKEDMDDLSIITNKLFDSFKMKGLMRDDEEISGCGVVRVIKKLHENLLNMRKKVKEVQNSTEALPDKVSDKDAGDEYMKMMDMIHAKDVDEERSKNMENEVASVEVEEKRKLDVGFANICGLFGNKDDATRYSDQFTDIKNATGVCEFPYKDVGPASTFTDCGGTAIPDFSYNQPFVVETGLSSNRFVDIYQKVAGKPPYTFKQAFDTGSAAVESDIGEDTAVLNPPYHGGFATDTGRSEFDNKVKPCLSKPIPSCFSAWNTYSPTHPKSLRPVFDADASSVDAVNSESKAKAKSEEKFERNIEEAKEIVKKMSEEIEDKIMHQCINPYRSYKGVSMAQPLSRESDLTRQHFNKIGMFGSAYCECKNVNPFDYYDSEYCDNEDEDDLDDDGSFVYRGHCECKKENHFDYFDGEDQDDFDDHESVYYNSEVDVHFKDENEGLYDTEGDFSELDVFNDEKESEVENEDGVEREADKDGNADKAANADKDGDGDEEENHKETDDEEKEINDNVECCPHNNQLDVHDINESPEEPFRFSCEVQGAHVQRSFEQGIRMGARADNLSVYANFQNCFEKDEVYRIMHTLPCEKSGFTTGRSIKILIDNLKEQRKRLNKLRDVILSS